MLSYVGIESIFMKYCLFQWVCKYPHQVNGRRWNIHKIGINIPESIYWFWKNWRYIIILHDLRNLELIADRISNKYSRSNDYFNERVKYHHQCSLGQHSFSQFNNHNSAIIFMIATNKHCQSIYIMSAIHLYLYIYLPVITSWMKQKTMLWKVCPQV